MTAIDTLNKEIVQINKQLHKLNNNIAYYAKCIDETTLQSCDLLKERESYEKAIRTLKKSDELK